METGTCADRERDCRREIKRRKSEGEAGRDKETYMFFEVIILLTIRSGDFPSIPSWRDIGVLE